MLDFGLAKYIGDDGADLSGPMTAAGLVLGTPRYMAPEQIRGQPLSPATDIYAMGCVLFEMLIGSPLFAYIDAHELWRAHLFEPVPTLSSRAGRPFSRELESLVARMLAKDPSQRPGMPHKSRRTCGPLRP